MRVTYANCFAPKADADLLVTGEAAVAAASPAGTRTLVADERYDPDLAQALNERLGELAFTWARGDGDDPTAVHGVSAADLAGQEVLLTVLLPAARGVLDAGTLLEAGTPSALRTVVAAGGGAMYERIEAIVCASLAATVRARAGAGLAVASRTASDPRNARLFDKYAQSRNPAFLVSEDLRTRALTRAACAIANRAAALHRDRRPGVAVYQYNPTRGFAERHAQRPDSRLALVRYRFGRDDLPAMLRAGHRGLAPTGGRRRGEGAAAIARLDRVVRARPESLRERLAIEGVDLFGLLLPHLRAIVARYAEWADARAPAVARDLRRARAEAVLVPFDGPPEARLLVRVAQRLGLPTFVINDGWKGDDHSQEGMAADRPLAWSEGIARRYFGRRPGRSAIVTGDPRADAAGWRDAPVPRHGPLRRVLVGSLTFSPLDLNCRRSDPERFLEEVLEGIRGSRAARGAEVVVKLHPADRASVYAPVLDAFGDLRVSLVAAGDVLDMLAGADAYVTTYSTSLLEAAAAGVPFAYYRVNAQRLHPPFSGDPTMEARTASDPGGLAALLDAPAFREPGDPAATRAWVESHLGPRDGRASERVEAAILDALRERG